MITYTTASAYVLERFPELTNRLIFTEAPTLLFAELAEVTAEEITKSNKAFILRIVNLINDTSENDNNEVQGLISEFAITLFDLYKDEYAHFLSLLSTKASHLFIENINLWRNNKLGNQS